MSRWLIGIPLMALFVVATCAGAAGLGLRVADAPQGGALVTAVAAGGPAARAGLQEGDIILGVDGKRIASAKDLAARLKAQEGDEGVVLSVTREGWKRELRLEGTQAAVAPAAERGEPAGGCARGWLGVMVREIPDGKGVEVVQLVDGSAARGVLLPGDLIATLDGERVSGARVFVTRIGGYPPGQVIRMAYLRDGRHGEASVRLGAMPEADCQFRLGSDAMEQKEFDAAVGHFRQALALRPGLVPAWNDLGASLDNLGRFEEAADAYGRGLALEPDNANLNYNAGISMRNLGREDEAVRYWRKTEALDPGGYFGDLARQQLAQHELQQGGDSVAARSDRMRASVAVGDFQVKAAKATQEIGDGLREMLVTALHQSGYFLVVERMDIKGLAAEQALSRSAMARPSAAHPEGGMEVADIIVYGVVSEFEPRAGGMAFGNFIPQMHMTVKQSTQFAEMAIDIRAVDVRTGRVLVAQRIPGTAQSQAASMGAGVTAGGVTLPVSLGSFHNTPMEQAIRDSVQKAVYFVINNLPESYFRHR